MKKYISNRVREAFKISQIIQVNPTLFLLENAEDEEAAPAQVNDLYMEKHQPQIGGYYLRYTDDGYESYCPAEVFENGSNVEIPDGLVLESLHCLSDEEFEAKFANGFPTLDNPGDFMIVPNETASADECAILPADAETEALIQAEGATVAPRVVPEMLLEHIDFVAWYRMDEVLTVCVIHLKNGFRVTGESACACPENFNWTIGKKISLENAQRKIWGYLGYTLREKLHTEPKTARERLQREHDELVERRNKLMDFIGSEHYEKLDDLEKARLIQQEHLMACMIRLLGERYADWKDF